jgi:hypothetical protein
MEKNIWNEMKKGRRKDWRREGEGSKGRLETDWKAEEGGTSGDMRKMQATDRKGCG